MGYTREATKRGYRRSIESQAERISALTLDLKWLRRCNRLKFIIIQLQKLTYKWVTSAPLQEPRSRFSPLKNIGPLG